MGFWEWVENKYQRFVKGVKHIVNAIGHILDVAHMVHTVHEVGKAVAWTAGGVAKVINSAAGQACVYLETTTVSCLSSPFCFLQAANLFWPSVIGIVIVGGLLAYGIGK